MAATLPSASRSERSGRWFARAWKALVRQEIRVTRWMVGRGIPASLATGLLWLAKIALIVMIGYALFWLAVVLAIIFVAAWILRHADLETQSSAAEWRQGFLGFGLYDRLGQRIDPHDPTAND